MTPGQSDHNCPDWAKPRFSGHTELGFLACLLLPCGLLPKLLLPHKSLHKRLVECQLSRNSLMWFRGFLCGGSGLLTWTSRTECWAVFVFSRWRLEPSRSGGLPPHTCICSSALLGFRHLLLRDEAPGHIQN